MPFWHRHFMQTRFLSFGSFLSAVKALIFLTPEEIYIIIVADTFYTWDPCYRQECIATPKTIPVSVASLKILPTVSVYRLMQVTLILTPIVGCKAKRQKAFWSPQSRPNWIPPLIKKYCSIALVLSRFDFAKRSNLSFDASLIQGQSLTCCLI